MYTHPLFGATARGGKEEQRYLRHIILHYVPKRRTNAVLIYVSPRGDKKKEKSGKRRGGERRNGWEIRFFVTAVVAKNFAGNHQDNAVGGMRTITVVHLLRAAS